MCDAPTLPEYDNICTKIERKVPKYGLSGWWHWWKPRSFHLVPALRGFNLPRSNIAEGGQSKLKGNKMSLIESVFEDAIGMLVQASNYENFLENREKVRGHRPSKFDRDEKQRREEKCYVESAVTAIRSGTLLQSALKNRNEKKFVPGARARHKAPRDSRTGVQGITRDLKNQKLYSVNKRRLNRNTNKEDNDVYIPRHKVTFEPDPNPLRTNPDRPGHGTNPKYGSDTLAGNGRRNNAFDDPTQRPDYGVSCMDKIDLNQDHKNIPKRVEERQLEILEKVEYVLLGKESKTTGVSRCQGCRDPIKQQKYFTPPMNLVFRYKMYRKYPKDGQMKYSHDKHWGYFHAEDMCCIRNHDELRRLGIDDVYMTNSTFL